MARLPDLKDVVPLMAQGVGAMGRLIEQRIDGEPPFQREYRHLGLAEPACFLGLDMALALPAVGRIYRRMGALPASAENAAAAFRRGAPLLESTASR